jgi:hypothetical protein
LKIKGFLNKKSGRKLKGQDIKKMGKQHRRKWLSAPEGQNMEVSSYL